MAMYKKLYFHCISFKFFNVYFSFKYIQLGYQLLAAVATAAWSFVLTFIILQLIGFLPFIRLKLSEKEEEM